MASRHDFTGLHHAATEVLVLEKTSIPLFGGRRRSVERDVSALGANDDLFAFDVATHDHVAERFTNGSL